MDPWIALATLGVVFAVQVLAWIRSSARTATVLEHMDRIISDHEGRLRHLEGGSDGERLGRQIDRLETILQEERR